MNKNQIIFGVVAVILIGGLFYFFGGNSVKSKTLTRDEAAKIILNTLKNSPDIQSVSPDKFFHQGYATLFTDALYGSSLYAKTDELQKAGLIDDIKHPNPADPRYKTFTFTDKAKPYLQPDTYTAGAEDMILGRPLSVVITGLTQPAADKSGHNVITAAYIVKFQLTPFGQILSGSAEQRGSVDFVLYDDGWRLVR